MRERCTASDGHASPRSTQNAVRGPRAARNVAAVSGGGVPPVLPALSGVHGWLEDLGRDVVRINRIKVKVRATGSGRRGSSGSGRNGSI